MNKDKSYLFDLEKAAEKVLNFSRETSKKDLAKNEEKQSAILYQIIIIGEVVKRLSKEFREQNSHIPWREIAGMRDIVIHQYDEVNFNTLWDVVKNDIPELLKLLKQLDN